MKAWCVDGLLFEPTLVVEDGFAKESIMDSLHAMFIVIKKKVSSTYNLYDHPLLSSNI